MDASLNRRASKLAAAIFPDKEAPQTPIFWKLNRKGDTLDLEWNAVPDEDLAQYTIFQLAADSSWQEIDSTLNTRLQFIVDGPGFHSFAVEAVDSSGNRSELSNHLEIVIKKEGASPEILSVQKRGKGLVIQWAEADTSNFKTLILSRIDPGTGLRLDIWQGSARKQEYFDRYATYDSKWRFELNAYDNKWRKGKTAVFFYEPRENE